MSGYILSPLAAQDLDDLWEFFARNNLDAADRILEEIYVAIQRLVRMPLLGHVREDLYPVLDIIVYRHSGTGMLPSARPSASISAATPLTMRSRA